MEKVTLKLEDGSAVCELEKSAWVEIEAILDDRFPRGWTLVRPSMVRSVNEDIRLVVSWFDKPDVQKSIFGALVMFDGLLLASIVTGSKIICGGN